ncbi:MAG: nucleotidyltransferase domain-containing protein [Bacillaceae bacterium]|nr:nucleotidyltransferase domain-containing protein [Bacillaceae bacterium]
MEQGLTQMAKRIIQEHFPGCRTALLCGSHVRGQGTATSDLDLVIIDDTFQTSFRESFLFQNKPVECFRMICA